MPVEAQIQNLVRRAAPAAVDDSAGRHLPLAARPGKGNDVDLVPPRFIRKVGHPAPIRRKAGAAFAELRFEERQGPYKVAPGELWVLGDNRNNSSDSRAWLAGQGDGVPSPNIKGRAMFVWMSFGPDGGVTWDRLFSQVLGKPRLPKGAPAALLENIERCLAQRPPVSQTTPPRPR